MLGKPTLCGLGTVAELCFRPRMERATTSAGLGIQVSILLRVAYDGTHFHGFARQRELRTVQGELERAISGVHGGAIECRGASRTDAGVHALGQIVGFEARRSIPPEGQVLAINARLPDDLVVTAAWEQAAGDGAPINPRFGNLGKHYRYSISRCKVRNPIADRSRWRLFHTLDLEAMRAGAAHFLGRHDFAGFRASDCQAGTTERRMTAVELSCRPSPGVGREWVDHDALFRDSEAGRLELNIDIHGDAFLKNMVRIMVGSLVEVGRGRREPAWIAELLERGDRQLSGPTAPAQGLTLIEVRWPHEPDVGD